MPQFNPEWFASQIFWLVVTFVVLYLLMSRIALPRVSQIIEDRQNKVEDDLAKAEKLRTEAQEVYEAYEKALQEARADAQKVLRETGDEIAAEQAKRNEAFTKELDQKTREAEDRIQAAKTEALDSLQSVAGEVAQSATAKLIGANIGKDRAEKAVKQAMGGES
jgi:F-type H+-transporting ATPase subunit b